MSSAPPPVSTPSGTSSPAGATLRELFSHLGARTPGGCQLAVLVDGEVVVDLAVGGVGTDTPVQVFSISKAVVAVAAAHAHAAGVLDLDQPVRHYWPAFDRPSTASITARMFLDHSAGIPAVESPLTLEDLVSGGLDAAVERQELYWEPGTRHGYSPFTFGALVAGVFRHGVGTSVQEYVREHVVEPAGADFWFGAPKEVLGRLAPLTFAPPALTEGTFEALRSGTAIPDGSFVPILADQPAFFADRRVQQADWPSMSGVSHARGLADIFTAVLGHGQVPGLLDAAAVDGLRAPRSTGWDHTGNRFDSFGSGVELPHAFLPLLGPGSFGHQGAGGSLVAVHPETRTVVAYVTTAPEATLGAATAGIALLAGVRSELESGRLSG